MVKKTLYFGNPAYLSLRNRQMVKEMLGYYALLINNSEVWSFFMEIQSKKRN